MCFVSLRSTSWPNSIHVLVEKKVLSAGDSWWFSGLLTAESVGRRTNFGANGYTETGLEQNEKKDAWTFLFPRIRMEYYFPP